MMRILALIWCVLIAVSVALVFRKPEEKMEVIEEKEVIVRRESI
jgi:hypothetical protein